MKRPPKAFSIGSRATSADANDLFWASGDESPHSNRERHWRKRPSL